MCTIMRYKDDEEALKDIIDNIQLNNLEIRSLAIKT